MLKHEGSLDVLFKELESAKWDTTGLSKIRRTGKEFLEIKDWSYFLLQVKGKTTKVNNGILLTVTS